MSEVRYRTAQKADRGRNSAKPPGNTEKFCAKTTESSQFHDRVISIAELITAELKRCADELAACDLSMQTIRKLIEESAEEER